MAIPNLSEIQNGQKWPFQIYLKIFPKKTGINSEWPKMAVLNFFQQFSPKRMVQIQNGQKWLFQIFSDNFPKRQFRMTKNGHSEYFLTIFPKKTGTNLEWPFQIFSNNFSQKD